MAVADPRQRLRQLDLAADGDVGEFTAHRLDVNRAARTALDGRRVLLALQDELGAPLAAASTAQLAAWLRGLRLDGLAASTRSTYLAHVREFYRWLVLDGRRDDDPTARLQRIAVDRGVPRDTDPGPVLALLPQLDQRRAGARAPGQAWLLLALPLLAGLRCCETAAVERRHLQRRREGHYLHVIGKGRRARWVPVDRHLAAAIRACDPGPLLPHRDDPSTPTTANAVSQRTRALLRRHGLTITAHTLRHTYAYALHLAVGGDVLKVQAALGHASVLTTQGYVRADAVTRAELARLYTMATPDAAAAAPPRPLRAVDDLPDDPPPRRQLDPAQRLAAVGQLDILAALRLKSGQDPAQVIAARDRLAGDAVDTVS